MLQHEFAIFCDDIRQENNGKFLIIGCYSDSMVVSSFPYSGALCALVYTEKIRAPSKCRFEYRLQTGATLAKVEMELNLPPGAQTPRIAQIPVPSVPISLSSPNIIELWFAVGNSSLEKIGDLHAVQGAVPS